MAEAYSAVALSPVRKMIAARMTEAVQTIPHFRVCAEIQADALLGLLEELRALDPDAGLSLNDLLIKACADALMEVPAVNVQWQDGEIHQYRSADISVVMALEDGLSTPIIRRAETRTVREISAAVKALRSRAAKKALKMEEVFGGSFSISNLGMYGVDQFDAIINPPQCAILAVGAARPRVLVAPGGELRVGRAMSVTLSADHRAVDGATAAGFLSALRRRVEQPGDLIAARETA